MSTCLYYYTGTGNSLWVTRQLAARINGPVDLRSLGTGYELPGRDCDRVGLIFPVHMWGLPRRVKEFISQLESHPNRYFFAVAVNAGQVAATLLQLRSLLSERGIVLSAGFEIPTPSNYIIWNGAQPTEKQQQLFAAATQKLDRIVPIISHQQTGPIEKGPWWQNVIFSVINTLASQRIGPMDKDFWVNEKCNSCGICAQVCPAANIHLEAGRPVWLHHCEQCLACLQWCPQEAIHFAKKTSGKKRYHNPEVSLPDMLAAAKRLPDSLPSVFHPFGFISPVVASGQNVASRTEFPMIIRQSRRIENQ